MNTRFRVVLKDGSEEVVHSDEADVMSGGLTGLATLVLFDRPWAADGARRVIRVFGPGEWISVEREYLLPANKTAKRLAFNAPDAPTVEELEAEPPRFEWVKAG